jgi:hypothetical protein
VSLYFLERSRSPRSSSLLLRVPDLREHKRFVYHEHSSNLQDARLLELTCTHLSLSMEMKCLPSNPARAEIDMVRLTHPFLMNASAPIRTAGWFRNRRPESIFAQERSRSNIMWLMLSEVGDLQRFDWNGYLSKVQSIRRVGVLMGRLSEARRQIFFGPEIF